MVSYFLPFTSWDCIILFYVSSYISCKALHVVWFRYFKFDNFLVNNSLVCFLVWEGMRYKFDEIYLSVFVTQSRWHRCINVMCEVGCKTVFKFFFQAVEFEKLWCWLNEIDLFCISEVVHLRIHHVIREIKVSFNKVKWFGIIVGLVVSYVLVPTSGLILGFG
jgi:hypothetical protein